MEDLDLASDSDVQVSLGDDDDGGEAEQLPRGTAFEPPLEAKLRELLHKINSIEIKLCSDAAKEFIKLLKGEAGGQLLHLFVQTSPKLSELLEAWKLRQGKPGISYMFSLISAILSHPEGKYVQHGKERTGASRHLDKFAQRIVDEKLDVIYKELNSKEVKCQNAALLLLASIVRRGSSLASEVAKKFNFKLQGFSKLAEFKKKQNDKKKHSSRKSFVVFAMSFLEVGKPGLLRWILQQKEMFSGVLRGLGKDDDDTITYILTTLRDKVLTEESLVSPALRSVLFGSVTLEQLVNICGREDGGPTSELAYHLLVMVCTDPCNGLMPDLGRCPNPLRGNPKRLLGVMKKLKATENGYHKDLLLAILRGRPSLAAAYLDEFPYNLEDHASPTWFSSVSLAANLVSSVGVGHPFGFLDAKAHDPPSFDSEDVQGIMSCICPRPFSRSMINKGLLHSDFLVKHGTLRLLWEALKLLDSLISYLSRNSGWTSLYQEIQNEVRITLPDAQVLLTLLSSLGSHTRTCEKRKVELEKFSENCSKNSKKMKMVISKEDTDIILCGISSAPDITLSGDLTAEDTGVMDESDREKEFLNVISEIWDLDQFSCPFSTLEDAEQYLHSRLLDALKIYLRAMPTILEGSFDFFMNLLSNPLALTTDLQLSLLSLLIEYIGWSSRNEIPIKSPPFMYKHLQPFIHLLIFSPNSNIKDRAYKLARAAMLSTGAFDRNLSEIDAWFLFLPGYGRNKLSLEDQEIGMLQGLSTLVISFLCDAISTIGNNLFKYWDIVRNCISRLKVFKGLSLDFSPLIICVLQKCLRVLNSESGTFSLYDKAMISLYVCNTLKFLLQTQVDARLLSALFESLLLEELGSHSVVSGSGDFLCEWRPLNNLLLFAQRVLHQQTCCLLPVNGKAIPTDGSFSIMLGEVENCLRSEHGGELTGVAKAFYSTLSCVRPDEILKNFPLAIAMSQKLLGAVGLPLSSIIFSEQNFIARLSTLWPEVFLPGLEMALSMICHEPNEDNPQEILLNHSLIADEMICNINPDKIQTAAASFSLFLKDTPFHVLFPAFINVDIIQLKSSKIQDFFLAKLSDWMRSSLVFLLQNLSVVLFWFYQVRLVYESKSLAELEDLSQICLVLVKQMLFEVLALKPEIECTVNARVPLSAETIGKVAEFIFRHPAAMSVLSCPLNSKSDEKLTIANFGDNLETFLSLSRERVHKLDLHVLDMLAATLDYLLSQSSRKYLVLEDGATNMAPPVKLFRDLAQRLFLELRNKFDTCIASEDFLPLLPAFYTLHALIQFISPFELLEVVLWIFGRVSLNELDAQKSSMVTALSVAFCITDGAFEALSTYLLQPGTKKKFFDLLWEMKEKTFYVDLIEDIYVKLCKFACDFKLHFADVCLLKALNALKGQNFFHLSDHLSSIAMSRILVRSPIQMISHCICQTNMTKAKLLLVLIEISPLHMSVFGQVFLCISNGRSIPQGNVMEDIAGYSFSDEDFMMLLPAALSYLNATFVKFGKQHYKHFASIASFYSRILLNGFLCWKSFVSGYLFQEEYGKFFPSSAEQLFNLIEGSLLGKAICLLQYHFSLNGDSFKMKERLQLFNSLFPSSAAHEELLDCDVNRMDFLSVDQSLNLINKVVAKISFCRMLLFTEDDKSLSKEADGGLNTYSFKMGSSKGNSSRMRFINILVGTWQWMVKKLPAVQGSSMYITGKSEDCMWLCKCLEVFILRTIYELTMKMHDYLIQLQSISFLEQLMRSVLLYRFEDPQTVRMLRHILALLSDGKFSHILYLQLLLAHSQFAPIICSISKSYSSEAGSFFRSMSSILRLFVIPRIISNAYDEKDGKEAAETYAKQLEIVKLLRTLLKSISLNSGVDSINANGINLGELHSLLLFSYGATLSEIDLEIYDLMNKIELIDEFKCEKIAEVDYLWGSTALKVRKERALELDTPNCVMTDTEAVEEARRIQFRENIQVDPKVCATTVLYFPYERTASGNCEPLSLNELQTDDFKDFSKPCFADAGNIRRYDPVLILRFSIHCLSSGYIEPAEFAGLGLLAVAFVSMSSPDLGMRKLGYETLGRFKSNLEKYQKKKDLMHLCLLLTFMQNGIEEPWQKIPSVIALFAAEASIILLDPLHDHYTVLSKLLTHSSRVNMKEIPFFSQFFRSSSINFRKERLWVLRLACVGLNLDDDAQIYIKNSIIESLMSFYTSSDTDNESKELILEVVRKAVKLQKMAHFLVEHCGLFSWLSSILSVYSEVLLEDEKRFFLVQLSVVIEVVNVVNSLKNITEWLQRCALEQLMELSCHLYKLLQRMNLVKENVALVNPILEIFTSTLTLSQKREMHQPHFALALEGLFIIYEAANVHNIAKCNANAELGLKAILLSIASVSIFYMSREKLSSFLSWAISTALGSESKAMLHCNLADTLHEESLTSKLLRWLVAVVIHGKLSWKLSDFNTKFPKGSKAKTLESLLEFVEERCEEINKTRSDCDEILVASVYHLYQCLGVNCRFLPSVVSVLFLLLFSDVSKFAGSDFVHAHRTSIMSLCSRICCPPEAGPAWRWSFFEPWRDRSSELTDLQRIDEIHACQTLLAMIPNVLGKKAVDLHVLSHQDVFKWERSIIEANSC